jgi:hypothetical protein
MATKREQAGTKRERTVAAAERNPKTKVVRNTTSGKFTDKAAAKTDPKGTVTETVKRAKGRKAVPRKAEEPKFQLIGSEDGGCYDASEWMTKGELLSMLADEISHTPINERGAMTAFDIPKEFGAVADLLYTTRQRRLDYQHHADALKVHETALKEHLISNMPKSKATGAAGEVARAQIEREDQPVVEDWEVFYAHIAKKKEFDLLNRALNRKAVKARFDMGKTVPGVGTFPVMKVSVTKIGGVK